MIEYVVGARSSRFAINPIPWFTLQTVPISTSTLAEPRRVPIQIQPASSYCFLPEQLSTASIACAEQTWVHRLVFVWYLIFFLCFISFFYYSYYLFLTLYTVTTHLPIWNVSIHIWYSFSLKKRMSRICLNLDKYVTCFF
jgi:hypothetical protein